ncbi:hypothetical protein V6N12_052504 [Hibiscus sabdariffa]|uniref:Uncharacterized protein n=1 Tax=Hibiscus sabdariffa TaxID=183260 RepID=A0ABR2C3L2_9ROSI
MDASSVAPGECSPYNWGYNISTEEMLYQIFDGGDELLQQDFRSMAQTSYMESSMPVPQHLKNSHGALSSEPDPTHQDLALNEPQVENVNSQLDKAAAGTPSQACNGKKRKEPERNHKKREADRKYRADIKVHGDIAKDCKLGAVVSNTTFAFLCAAIKVMGDLSLDQVTEEVILKLRDPIMDAKRCKFALQHLKTVAQAYFGLKALRDYNKLKHKLESLRTAEEALRKKLQEKSQEINATEAKLRDLTSDKCRICQESAKRIVRN